MQRQGPYMSFSKHTLQNKEWEDSDSIRFRKECENACI